MTAQLSKYHESLEDYSVGLPKTKIKTSKTLLTLLALVISASGAQAQQIQQTKKPFTTFDGATSEKYVTYLKLDGSQGVRLPLLSQAMDRQLEYTLMLWFKPAEEGWGSRYQYAFEVSGAMECYFTASNQIMCDSAQKCERLIADVSNVQPNRWTHLSLIGSPNQGSQLLLETNQDLLATDHKSYLILQQDDSSWHACLGGCDNLYGFIGGLRDFVFINRYVTPEVSRRIKNHYLNWDPTIIGYYRFTEKDFLKDQFRANYAQITYKNTSSRVIQARDFIPNDICYPFLESALMHRFPGGQTTQSVNIDGRWTPKETGWAYSMTMWLMVDSASCSNSNAYDARTKCFLVNLEDAFMLYFAQPNQAALYFFNQKPYYETQSSTILVPHNQWVNIQMGVSQYSGYEIISFDVLGRVIQYTFQKKDMQAQKIDNKVMNLFNGFVGFVRTVAIFTTRRAIPIVLPFISYPNPGFWTDGSCLGYYRFDSLNILGNQAINMCGNRQHAALARGPFWQGTYFAEYPYGSTETKGLTTSSQKLFDGIACDDGSKVNQLTSQSSFIKTQAPRTNYTMNNATVEFWFRTTQNISLSQYYFTLWGLNSTKEFLTIFFDTPTQNLICAPFGWDSIQSPFVAYKAFTPGNVTKYGWFHLVCQFDMLDTKQATGYIHRKDLEERYQIELNRVQFLPNDTFDVFLGNNRNATRGTVGLLIRELRVWGYKREIYDIQLWRYRQLDPRNLKPYSLLVYLRLDEGNFDYFNFAAVIYNQSLTAIQTVTYQQLRHVRDSDLLVCPLQTFPSADYSKCYQDPLQNLVSVIYPTNNSDTGVMEWTFDSTTTQLINPVFFDQLRVRWQFEDQLIKSLAKTKMSEEILSLPAKAFIGDSQYKVKLNYSNADITFNQILDHTFVPSSCFYYSINDTGAAIGYHNYTTQQSTADIIFTLQLNYLKPNCSNFAFYNQINPNLTYRISPSLEKNVTFDIKFDSETQKFTVKIPLNEQYKLPVLTDISIIFDFKWTNSEYSRHLNTSGLFVYSLTFANAIYTINFFTFGLTVIPDLKASRQMVLKNEEVVLDASETYVLYAMEEDKKKGLTITWGCPQGLQSICVNKTGPLLNITAAAFNAANGTYNQSYEFTVLIAWAKTINETKNFQTSVPIIWQNVVTPAFTLYPPNAIKVSNENQLFSIILDNYDVVNSTVLQISWSIQPNLTAPLNLTQNNTVLTVSKNGFAILTTYTITVTVTNVQWTFATRSRQISFTTSRPPFGGTASITPQIGNARDTNFTITLSNWQSSNRPIKYRVWATSNFQGTTLLSQLTDDWFLDNQFFKFKAINANPLIVEITDSSGEIAQQKVSATITDRSPRSFQALYKDFGSISQVLDRYVDMSQFIDYINQFPVNQTANTTTNTSITTEIINPQQQVTSRGIVTGQIFKDVQNIRNQKSIESGESQVIIQNSVNMLSLITAQPAFIDEYIAQSSIVIIRKIQEVIEVTPRLLQSDEGFKENLGITLSNLLKFAQNKREALNKGRRLFNTTTDEGLNAIFDQIRALKNSYAQLICESINPDSIQQSLSTDTFTLKLERFSKYSSVELRSFLATENPKTRVTLRVKDLIHTLSASDPNFDSFCVHVTYFKVPMKPSSLYEQYSESQIDFELPGYDTVNFKPHMRMLLELEPVSYRSNQTVCMAYLNVAQSWSQEVCETSINEDTLEIECKCNMIDTLYYGLFTDASRKFGESLKIQKEKATSNTSQSSSSMRTSHTQSVAYIGILMLLLIFGLVIPASIYALDRKDKKAAMERKLNSQQNQQINLIARLSNYPQEYWQAHFETVMNYSLQGKSLISHLFAHVHPYLSLFTFYDPLQPRLTRHLFPLLQTSFFALTCILVFSPSYRQLDTQRLDSSLDQTDLDLILLIGAIGMVALLPIPYTQSLFRQTPQKQKVKLRVIQQQEAHKTQPDCTSEQQINQHSPVQILQTHHRVTSSNPMQAQYKPEEEASATAFNPQLKYLPLQIVLALVSIGTFIAALSLLIYQLPQLPASNQYCLLASMYIGVFGNLFLVQPARVFINTLLAHKALINKRIRFIVSAETVRVVQEIAWVREAEHQKECVEDVKPIVKEKNEVKESLMNQTVANNHRQQTDSEDLCIFAGQIPNNSDASKQLDELVVHSQSESPNRRSKGGILSGLGDYQAKKNPLLFSQGFESLRKGPDQKYSGIKEDSMIKQQINSTQEE